MKCKYKSTYRENYDSPEKYFEFDCSFGALDSGYCIFHDDKFYKDKENQERIQKTLDSIFDQSSQNNLDITCIGYKLPTITIKKNFKGRVFFDKTQFFGPIIIESTFMKDASFKGCQFHEEVSFSKSKFKNFITFSNTVFSKFTNFATVEFDQPWFNETEFLTNAYFANATFSRHVTFQKCKIKSPYFRGANFMEGVTLGGCVIEEGVFESIYEGDVYVYGTTFESMNGMNVTFGKAQFSNRTRFVHCSFNTIAFFNDIIFDAWLEFEECHFMFAVNFKQTKFSHVSFVQSEFDGPTYFGNCNFSGEASFSQAKFKKFVDFSKSDFSGDVNFSQTEFERVNFIENKFQKVSFFRTKFYETIFKNVIFADETKFHFTFFEDQNRTIFNGMNLENVSFLNTNILRIKFDNVEWGKDERYKIFEERMIEHRLKSKREYDFDFTLDEVLAIYRSLRENYENRLKYDEAGEFFVREMEVKRNYKEIRS